jgi:Ca2+-binding RTX toxin-like protein
MATIIGNGTAELIIGSPNADDIFARGGNDTVRGGAGDDTMRGEAGNDLLIGETGNDIMLGGNGNDTMVWNNGDGSDVMEGGAGTDEALVNGSDTAGDVFTIGVNGNRIDFDRVNFGQFSLDIGTTETLRVNGAGGHDVITGGLGLAGLIALQLNGGAGNDTITGGDGDDTITGGDGNDVLVGSRGNDRISAFAGNDRMIWNNGDGSDILEGAGGFDTAVVNGSDTAADLFTINPNGARVDFDRVNFGQFSLDIGTSEALVVNGLAGNDTITGASGLDGLIALQLNGGVGNDSITGGDGDDVMAGDAGSDRLIGFRGDDTMLGGGGNDRMIWNNGDGTDVMEGGAGNDVAEVNGSDTAGDEFTILANGLRVDFDRVNFGQFGLDIGSTETLVVNGLGGNDTMTGGEGLDGIIRLQLNGGLGNDTIIGGDGDDVMAGGAGNDRLVGFRGDDAMLGGGGADRMVWNNGDGTDLMEGGAGNDVAEVNGSDTAGDEFTVVANGNRVDFDRVNFGQFGLDIGTTETLIVNGLGGDDTMTAGTGLDPLIDIVFNGGAGNDSLTGGDGDDLLHGGAGADTFVFGRGQDTIDDFQNGVDRIKLAGLAGIDDFGDLAGLIQDIGPDVRIDFGANELTIENIQPGALDAGDFLFA